MSDAVTIRRAQDSDRHRLAAMQVSLWPESSLQEQLKDLERSLNAEATIVLIALDSSGELIGFLETGLRSHADGCDTSRPVGFVEGWFVREAHRNRGVGRALMQAAEAWARSQGCLEMASDTLLDNQDGQLAHQALGFEVVDRCVHYRKHL